MPTVDDVLAAARTQLGTRETGRNVQKYGAAYGSNGVAWCQIFCWWVMQQVPGGAGLLPKSAYTPYVYDWFKARGQTVTAPQPGDLVYFNWRNGTRAWPLPQHVGFVEHVNPDGSLVTIEANTQQGTTGNQSDGGGVWRRTRAASPYVVGYGRPAYSPTSGGAAVTRRLLKVTAPPYMSGVDVVVAQTAAGVPVAERDGKYGPGTAGYMRAFQTARGLDVDGEVGPQTWAAIDAVTKPSPSPRPAPSPPAVSVPAAAPAPAGEPLYATWRHDGGPTLTGVDLLRSVDRELNSRLPLHDRPGPDVDTIFGHVLSLRAELRAFRDDTTSRLARLAQTGGLPATVSGLDTAALRALAVAVVDEQGRRLTPPAA